MDEKKRQLLWKLEGLHTVETVAEELGISRQAAINLLSKLKKEMHVTTSGGGKKKRLYKITIRKQLPREQGMFDIINKHSPNMKLNEWYDHQVHGHYGVEEALVQSVDKNSFRVLLASLFLFQHINDWQKLYKLSQEKGYWQKIGALYDIAKMFMKVKKMPEKYRKQKFETKKYLIERYDTKEERFTQIKKKWNVEIPFRSADFREVITW